MTLQDLKLELIKNGISDDAYSLNGGLPNEKYCINFSNSLWEIYYSERGNKTGTKTFQHEKEACEYFLSLMKKIFKI